MERLSLNTHLQIQAKAAHLIVRKINDQQLTDFVKFAFESAKADVFIMRKISIEPPLGPTSANAKQIDFPLGLLLNGGSLAVNTFQIKSAVRPNAFIIEKADCKGLKIGWKLQQAKMQGKNTVNTEFNLRITIPPEAYLKIIGYLTSKI
jgi:hypothetical protein